MSNSYADAIRSRWSRIFAAALTAAMLVACGGAGSGTTGPATGSAACVPSDAATAAECGTLLVGLTDAEGDIVSYTVDVLSLRLQRADGAMVETLPAATRVDFAALTELSELISASLLPPGTFVGGTIRIDYSNAEIFVEAGGDVVPATITGADGSPLGIVELAIDLADGDHLVVRRGRVAFLSLDFDLATSHTVDTGTVPPTVVAQPFLAAEVAPLDEKSLRVRGALVAVDEAASSYRIRLRPWLVHTGDHGTVTVHTTGSTQFEIGTETYTGAAGLAALARLDTGTLTAAFGTLDPVDRSFSATIVLARESVDDGSIDVVHGNIVARSGNLLTVKGARTLYRNGLARFRRTVFVEVGPDTSVLDITDRSAMHAVSDLSVGQRIAAFGVLTSGPEADAPPVLDATAGRVRMEPTHVLGTVTTIVPGQVTVDIRAIDRLGAELFDFTGTGSSAAVDADPSAYEIDTGALSLQAIAVGRVARFVGNVSAFGFAPPDFAAQTVVGYGDIPAALGVSWVAPGTTAPFSSMSLDGVVLDLANPDIGDRHHLVAAHEVLDLFDLPASPTIQPADARTLFALYEPGHVELYSDFGAFLDEMLLRLNGAATVRALAAYGHFDDSVNALEANRVVVFTLPAP